jgi:predicted dehydrogenase
MDRIRVGVVGAGGNTRLHHIPKLKAQEGVEIVSVCNRSRQSSERVAKEFGIPTIYDDWRELVAASDTNAIVIGTWPYLHCPVTLAALEAGKHVMTEARMAMNAREARLMLERARQHPHLVTQIVPSPFTLRVDRTVQARIAEGFLGEIYAIELRGGGSAFADLEAPLHWRHDRDLSGFNILNLGIWYEALMRWVGEARRVLAMTKVSVKLRRDAGGVARAVQVPDHVEVMAEMACGALARLQFSAVIGLAPGAEVWLFGRDGTLRYEQATQQLFGGRRGESALREIPVPPDQVGGWRVEEEFVNAIRGREGITHTTFEDGVKYMEFTEAVTRSAQTGQAIALPLANV